MKLRDELHRQRDAIAAIAARHGASDIRLFGSVARGEERPGSDIDLLVDLAEESGFGDDLALVEELEQLYGRRVDRVAERSRSPFFRPFVEAEARPL